MCNFYININPIDTTIVITITGKQPELLFIDCFLRFTISSSL